MRIIVKENGRYYAQEVVRIEEVTLASLENNLAALTAQKTTALAEKDTEYNDLIVDMQRQIDELKALDA